MGIKTGKPVLGNSMLSFVPLTAGTCLLVSMTPCYAAPGGNPERGMRHQQGGRHAGFADSSRLNQLENGFTQAFNDRVQRKTNGVDSRRFDLDLSSTLRNIELGSRMFKGAQSVTINAGGAQQTFSAGDQVTATQYVAIQQVLSSNPQSISVSAQGTASGGSFALDQAAASHVNNLLIPQSVSAVNNFANNRSVNLSGDLTNLGSIYGLSTSNRVRSGVIAADDINNSGNISTDLTGTSLQGAGDVRRVDLTLVAEHDIKNSGSITSSGALTVASAYGSLSNSGNVTAQRGDLNVFTGDGNLNNSGSISALNGNLNIDASQIASDLNINGAGGTFNALRGDINIRDLSYTDVNDTTIDGGTYNSQNLNIYAGGGTINASVKEIDGKLNTSGFAAHVLADGGTLTLGVNCLTGDPTFANSTGDILITGGVIAGESIAILAAGDIIASGNAFINTSNSTGATAAPNTNVTLVAGALVTTSGAGSTTIPGTGIGAGKTATVNFTAGALGGNIDFSKSKYIGPLIDTSSDLVGGGGNQQDQGGNVLIAAFSNGIDNGFVKFPTARPSIKTSSLYDNSGSVTIIAGAPGGTKSSKIPAITTGNIDTQADPTSGNNSGDVVIFAAQPETSTGAPITFNSSGDITGVVFFEVNPANLTFSTGNIQFNGSVLASDANVTAQTGTGGISQLTSKLPARIQGNTVSFTAGVGGIGAGVGTNVTRIFTEANTLTLTSGSNVFINNLGSVTLGNATTPNTTGGNLGLVDITTTADQSGSGRISLRSGAFIQASSGLLTSVNLVSSGDVAGNGGIRTPGNATIIATAVTLSDVNPLTPTTLGSGFGDIGQNGGATHINVDSSTVSASTQGNVFIQSTGSIGLLNSTAGNGKTFELKTIPDGGGNGQITILGTIKSNFGRIGVLTLQSSESGAGVGGIIPGGTLVADTVNLRDDDGLGNLGKASIGTAAAPIVVDTSHLNVDTAGPEISIQNIIKTGMELQGVNSNALRSGTFALLSASTVHTTGTINVINSASITATLGNILLDADVNLSGANPTVFLTTSSGSIYSPGGEVRPQTLANAGNLSVTLTSKSGGIGTDVVPFTMQAGNLTANAPGYTNIYNQNTVALNLLATLAKNQFTLQTDGTLNINGVIGTATGVKLATTSGTAGININANVGSSKATNLLEIDTDGSGAIATAPLVILGAKQLINLSTDDGNIGTNLNPITVSTPGLSANTNTGLGGVVINALATKTVPLTLFNSGSGSDFVLNANGSVLLNNIVTVDGSISVVTTAGTLSTNINSVIQVAEPGNETTAAEFILLQNAAAKASKGAAISIGAGTKISTYVGTPGTGIAGPGSIRILATTTPVQTNTTLPANVVLGTQTGGTTFFGANGITALAPNNTMDNVGADITFDTGTKPASAIVLGGGVLLHADPPLTGTAPTQMTLPTVVESSLTQPTLSSAVDSGIAYAPPVMSSTTTSLSSTIPTSTIQALNNSGLEVDNRSLNSTLANFATLAAELSNAQAAINFCSTQKEGWISETELSNGDIPAQIFGDVTVSGDASAGAELEYPTSIAPLTVQKLPAGQPLVGAVTTVVGVPRTATLHRGTVMAAPSTDAVINTPLGQIKVGAKSLALVMAFANGLAVYDLDDTRKGAVEVIAGGKSITLSPGQHIFVTNSNVRGFEDVNPAQMIGYRGITSQSLNNGLKVFSAEFSVPHACNAVKPLRQLLKSNHPHDRKVANHLIKTTAVTMQLRGRNGDYQQVFRPRKTAWAQ
jgi:predicted ATPase